MDWRLFGAARYFKEAPDGAEERPHGAIELSPTFRAALQSRGLFRLGFDAALIHRLPPLTARLAVYLAKVFTYQAVHRRRGADLARALPVEAATEADARKVLARAARRLEAESGPTLAGFTRAPGPAGDWWAEFRRGSATPRIPPRGGGGDPLSGLLTTRVERIVEAVGTARDRAWWESCVRRLGAGPVDRALGQFREACQAARVRNRGGLLTKILKDLAAEAGVPLQGDKRAVGRPAAATVKCPVERLRRR
jgi:hypothetical protein